MKEFDVVAIGSSLMDTVMIPHDIVEITLFEPPNRKKQYLAVEYSTKRNVEKMKITPGGSAANTAIGLALLGLKVRYVGKLGDDLSGHAIAEDMKKHGIDISNVIFTKEAYTGISIVLMTPEGKDRSILTYKGANDLIKPNEIKDDFVTKCVLWTSLSSESGVKSIKRLIELGRKCNAIIIAGPSITIIRNQPKGAHKLVGMSDYCMCNLEEAEALTGKTKLREMFDYFINLGLKGVVITDGKNGMYGATDKGEYWHCGVYNVPVADRTGAGDAALAGFTYGILKGYSFQDSMVLGSAMAAFEVRELGVREGLPDEKTLLEFVKERRDEVHPERIKL